MWPPRVAGSHVEAAARAKSSKFGRRRDEAGRKWTHIGGDLEGSFDGKMYVDIRTKGNETGRMFMSRTALANALSLFPPGGVVPKGGRTAPSGKKWIPIGNHLEARLHPRRTNHELQFVDVRFEGGSDGILSIESEELMELRNISIDASVKVPAPHQMDRGWKPVGANGLEAKKQQQFVLVRDSDSGVCIEMTAESIEKACDMLDVDQMNVKETGGNGRAEASS
jgi:hypothetical protein